jgi:hypothetical protein
MFSLYECMSLGQLICLEMFVTAPAAHKESRQRLASVGGGGINCVRHWDRERHSRHAHGADLVQGELDNDF